jgi:putative ABC transport system permease protein
VSNYVSISLARLALAGGFALLAIAISLRFDLGLGRSIALGALRSAVQLIAVGYVLVFLFGASSAWPSSAALVLMLVVASITSARRVPHGPGTRRLLPYAALAISLSTALALVPLFAFVLPIRPWFDARFLIPLAGMMMSSAMNVAAQVFERIFSLAHDDRRTIEQLLALGASPRIALRPHARLAMRASLIPTINALVTAGLVSLPGMMTGQILSGVDPVLAVRYQLVILWQLVAVSAAAGGLSAMASQRILFSRREQLLTMRS